MLVSFSLSYVSQLRNRRRWRTLHLSRLGHSLGSASDGTPASSPAEQAYPELAILPVWTLFLPQAAVLLVLSFAFGQGADLLFYMV